MSTDQPAQGSTADYCSRWPGEPHAMATHMRGPAPSIRRCSFCGWIDFDDLDGQVRAQAHAAYQRGLDDGRRQVDAPADDRVLTESLTDEALAEVHRWHAVVHPALADRGVYEPERNPSGCERVFCLIHVVECSAVAAPRWYEAGRRDVAKACPATNCMPRHQIDASDRALRRVTAPPTGGVRAAETVLEASDGGFRHGTVITVPMGEPGPPEGEALGVTDEHRHDGVKVMGDLRDRLRPKRRHDPGALIEEPDEHCPAHGAHPHGGRVCLDCPICRPPAEPATGGTVAPHDQPTTEDAPGLAELLDTDEETAADAIRTARLPDNPPGVGRRLARDEEIHRAAEQAEGSDR